MFSFISRRIFADHNAGLTSVAIIFFCAFYLISYTNKVATCSYSLFINLLLTPLAAVT